MANPEIDFGSVGIEKLIFVAGKGNVMSVYGAGIKKTGRHKIVLSNFKWRGLKLQKGNQIELFLDVEFDLNTKTANVKVNVENLEWNLVVTETYKQPVQKILKHLSHFKPFGYELVVHAANETLKQPKAA